jgi:hypothetical protein
MRGRTGGGRIGSGSGVLRAADADWDSLILDFQGQGVSCARAGAGHDAL